MSAICPAGVPSSKLVVSGLPTLSNGSPRRTRLWESPSPLVRFWRCRGCSILSCDTTELDATSRQPLQHSDVTTLLTCRLPEDPWETTGYVHNVVFTCG